MTSPPFLTYTGNMPYIGTLTQAAFVLLISALLLSSATLYALALFNALRTRLRKDTDKK